MKKIATKKPLAKNRKLVLSDRDVELMRELHEEHPREHPEHIGYKQLARMFECSRSTVQNICTYRKRAGI